MPNVLVNVIALTISCTFFSMAADSGIVNMALLTLVPQAAVSMYMCYTRYNYASQPKAAISLVALSYATFVFVICKWLMVFQEWPGRQGYMDSSLVPRSHPRGR